MSERAPDDSGRVSHWTLDLPEAAHDDPVVESIVWDAVERIKAERGWETPVSAQLLPVQVDAALGEPDEDGLLPIERSLADELWNRWQDPRPAIPGVLIHDDPRTVARTLRPWLLAAVRSEAERLKRAEVIARNLDAVKREAERYAQHEEPYDWTTNPEGREEMGS